MGLVQFSFIGVMGFIVNSFKPVNHIHSSYRNRMV